MAEPTTAGFSRPFPSPAQFDLPGTPEPGLSGLGSLSAGDSEFAPEPDETVEATTTVNRLNGQPTQGERNVLIPSPEAAASRASQEQGIGTFADEFA